MADTSGLPGADTFSLRISKDTLDAPITYQAEDSAVILVPEKKIVLYGKTQTKYKEANLYAPQVEIDQTRNTLTATGSKDSLGETVTRARFQESSDNFESDTIIYNFKSQKGYTRNTFTQQNEMFIQGQTIKKVNASTVFVKSGRFTTCDLDEPHFAFRANKLKIINNRVAVSGPMHPEFEGVPVPVYLPFGYYPLSRGRHSGLLPPQFVATENQGLGLEGLGYYKVINDYIDAAVRGNIYSYGGWRGDLNTTYRKRYRFNGAFNLSLMNTQSNFKGDPDFNRTRTFNISWSHAVDQRARPGVSFSANVNAGSTRFNRLQLANVQQNIQNNLNSSITYSKTWKNRFSLTLSANHNQNSETRLVSVSLPDAGFNLNTLYPLQRKEAVGAQRWYEKLGIGYQGAFRNNFAFYDSLFSFQRIFDTLSWGATHNVPLTLSLPPAGPLILAPSISYQSQWIQGRRLLSWNEAMKRLDTVNQKGLYTAHAVTFGFQANTNIFGTFQFRRSRVMAIRHTMRPSVGFNYTPNLARSYYRRVQIDSSGNTQEYNLFANGTNLNTGYGNFRNGGISFGLDNMLEMKLRPKKDSAGAEPRKVRLIDGLGFTGNYNFLIDSFRLSPINIYLRSSLFDKINLNANATLSPYAVDYTGRVLSRYAWQEGFGPGRITGGFVSLGTQFRSKPRDPSRRDGAQPVAGSRLNDPTLQADQSRLVDYMRVNPNQFVDFNIPYDFGLDLSLNFDRQPDSLYRVKTNITSSVNFRGSFSLTPKWNFSTFGFFDVNTKKLTALSLAINRDLHCWQLSIALSPIGFQRFFTISISPKSGLLQNLRINRTRYFTDF